MGHVGEAEGWVDIDMAWKSDGVSVVGLGMSCQTAWQMQLNADLFAEKFQKTGDTVTGYFNWLISPALSTAAMLRDGIPSFEREDVVAQKGTASYERYGVLYWHDFGADDTAGLGAGDSAADNTLDIDGRFPQMREKWDFLSARMRDIVKAERVLFVWSNTQNNLTTEVAPYGLDIKLTEERAKTLMEAAECYAGCQARFLFLTYPDRWSPWRPSERAMVVELQPDASEWMGDNGQWRDVLGRALDFSQ